MYIGPNFAFPFPVDLSVQVILPYDHTTITSWTFIDLLQFPWHFETDFGKSVQWCHSNSFSAVARESLNETVHDVVQCWLLPEVLSSMRSNTISDCCVSVPVLVARFSANISWHTKCIRNIWYVFPKFSEVICLAFLTPAVPHMACYFEFSVFWRQAIVACPIESMDFVIFLTLHDFLNIAKSHLHTFLFKVLVAFFWCMDGLYIILIIKTCRIRIEPCRLDDTFEKQRPSIPNEPLVKSWAKCFPSILKWIQFGVKVIWIYGFSNTIFIKVGNSRPVDLLLFPTKKVFCLQYFNRFLVEDLHVLIHLVSSNDACIST